MLSLILCDTPGQSDLLRQLLQRLGYECPPQNILSFEQIDTVFQIPAEGKTVTVVVLGKHSSAGLRAIHQLRRQTNGLIVAIGAKDTEVILSAVHAGADDYVDELLIDEELPGTLTRQCVARGIANPDGQLMLVISGNGGNGRSQVATNLSVAMAQLQQRSCLVELDMTGGNCAAMLSLKPKHTILDLSRHVEKLDRKTLEKTLIAHDTGVNLLPGPQEIVRPDVVSGELIERLVRIARQMFPHVLVDVQDLWQIDVLKQLATHRPMYLLVTRLDFNAVCNTSRVLQHLDRLGVERSRIKVIANREGEPGCVAIRKVEQILSVEIGWRLPDDPRTAHQAINSGIPYVLEAPAAPLSQQVILLAEKLTGIRRHTLESHDEKARTVAGRVRHHLQNLWSHRSLRTRMA
ncbi:P-loop NTPase [bacterium]|nr:P-loop NTPase [bacterium]